jgi:hypothetical protein
MTSIVLALILAAATVAPPAQDLAGNRIEAFATAPAKGNEGAPPLHCTADRRWCAEISRDVDQNTSTLHVFAGTPAGRPPRRSTWRMAATTSNSPSGPRSCAWPVPTRAR